MGRKYTLGLCVVFALGACAEDGSEPSADAGGDVAADATQDAAADVAADAPVADAGADTPVSDTWVPDAAEDAVADVGGGEGCAPMAASFGLEDAGEWVLIGDTARREPTHMVVSDCGVWVVSRNKSGDEEFKGFHSAGGEESLAQVESSFASDRLHMFDAVGASLVAFTTEGPLLRAAQGDPLTWAPIVSPEGASVTRAVWFDDVTYLLVDSVSSTDAWHQVTTESLASGTPTFDATNQLPGRTFELLRWGDAFLGHDRACVDGKIGSGEDGLECEAEPAFLDDMQVYHPHFAYAAPSGDLANGAIHLPGNDAGLALTLPVAVDEFPRGGERGTEVPTAWVSDNWFAFSVFDGAADQIVVVTGAGDGAPVASALEVPVHSIRGARSTVVSMWSDGEVIIVHVDNDNNTGNSEFYAMLLE